MFDRDAITEGNDLCYQYYFDADDPDHYERYLTACEVHIDQLVDAEGRAELNSRRSQR